MIKIENYKLGTNILLAPMAGCTDLAFRLITREHGAKFCFFEMVDSNSLIYKTYTKTDILKTIKKDAPIAGQLIGSDPDKMLIAAKKLLDLVDIDFLDINAACPVNKMTKKKSGAYLLDHPNTLFKMVKKLKENLSLPITVKLRTGYERSDIKALIKIAQGCEKNGASAIFIHGRTRSQFYSGEIDYTAIRAVKENVSIPVFGSGNIFTPELAKKMLDETLCDGIMVARGALGNPWIFKNIESYLKTGKVKDVTLKEKIRVAKKHLSYIEKYKEAPQKTKIGLMRKNALWYFKAFENAARIRGKINDARSLEELLDIIDSIIA